MVPATGGNPWRTLGHLANLGLLGTLNTTSGNFEYQWASDVNFDGIRLEVLTSNGDVLFDISIPESGAPTVNTFSNEVAAALVAAAVDVARERQ